MVQMDSPLGRQLHIEPVSQTAAPHVMAVPAEVRSEASRQMSIYAPLAGRIVSLGVSPGQFVHRGDILAQLASGDMAQALSDDAKARAALQLAQEQWRRAQSVFQIGGEASKDVESAHANVLQAQAEAQRTHDRLASLAPTNGTAHGSLLSLTAPDDGFVVTVGTSAGQNVTDTTVAIMTLVDLDEVWAVGGVPEDSATQVGPGMPAEASFFATGDRRFAGKVLTVAPVLSSDTRRMEVRMVVPNADNLLRPGMFGTLLIAVPQPPQVMVPQSALLMNNDSTTVFVETSAGVFERRTVTIGYDEAALLRVRSGLNAGERVVVQGAVLLNDD
ncbi:cation efflux system protein [Ameyamaea chiangmaiensis NBRC 103196]|nr:cation efflux system protein [Ameyamaea chiangmaiensis NBRC 103196]